jgi:hypothetical protein
MYNELCHFSAKSWACRRQQSMFCELLILQKHSPSFWRYKSYLEWNISVYLAIQWHKAFCIHNLSFSPACNSFLFVLFVNGWGLGQITFSVITRVEIQEELVLRFKRIAKELVMWTCSVSSLHISPLPDTCGAWRGVCWLVKIGLYLAYRTNS